MEDLQRSTQVWPVERHLIRELENLDDHLAIEEPLEIQVQSQGSSLPLAVTMRTPGHDDELAIGFLVSEGVLQHPSDLVNISRPVSDEDANPGNRIRIQLSDTVRFDNTHLSRHTFTSSSCGICGKQTIERVRQMRREPPPAGQGIGKAVLMALPQRLRQAQKVFQETGGLHGVGYFDLTGKLLAMREDVGRHNALDKLVGSFFLQKALPCPDGILLLSGRASFELIQKAACAGISKVAAIGAPSSLAVQLAHELHITLVGFLRHDRFNLYTGHVLDD